MLTPFDGALRGSVPEPVPGRLAVALLGVPFDHGVKLVGGRPGARLGPAALHAHLVRTLDLGAFPGLALIEAGLVAVVEEDVPATHARVETAVGSFLARGIVPLVLGGGHDLLYAGVAGMARALPGRIGGINVDAHLDAREPVGGEINSGTSIRRILSLLDDRVAGPNVVEVGIQPSHRPDHRAYLEGRGARIHFIEEVRRDGLAAVMSRAAAEATAGADHAFLSVDIDAVSSAHAPGCSAPTADGLDPGDVAAAVARVAALPAFRYFDVVEVNPRFDVGDRTLVTAARVLRAVLEGLSRRAGAPP